LVHPFQQVFEVVEPLGQKPAIWLVSGAKAASCAQGSS
jgi:hypothetical protein